LANHPQNVNGKKDLGDIWISLWIGGAWTAPVHGGSVINDGSYNAVAGFSADGNQLFLVNHFGKKGGAASTQGISVSKEPIRVGRPLKIYPFRIFLIAQQNLPE